MSTFLLRRTLTVFALVFGVLFAVGLLKGRGMAGALEYATLWAFLSTAVFAIVQAIRTQRGASCAVCEGGAREDEEAVLHG
jgi:hypothetical protein